MARIPYVEYENVSDELRPTYDRILATRPNVLNSIKMYANSPALTNVMYQYLDHLRDNCCLDLKLRELIVLTVARVTGYQYIWARHVPVAKTAGITDEQLRSLGKSLELFTERERAAIQYSAEIVDPGVVTDAAFAGIRRHFNPQEVVELTYLAAWYVLTHRFFATLHLDLEPEDEEIWDRLS